MDVKNAVKYLRESKCDQKQGENYQYYHNAVLSLAIQALERQIPKKPIEHTKLPNVRFTYLCPTCNRLYWGKESLRNYCNGCGQKFDLD